MRTKAEKDKLAAKKKADELINKIPSAATSNKSSRSWDDLDKFAPAEKYVQVKVNQYQWERLNFAATMSHRSMQAQAAFMMNEACDKLIKKLMKN